MSANLTITAADDIDADGPGSATTGSGGGGGSFPVNSVIDNFNRANEGPPPSASWGGIWENGSVGLVVTGNTCSNASNANGTSYWGTSFGPDVEAFVTITAFGSYQGVAARLAGTLGSSPNGYYVQAESSNVVTLFRVDGGSFVQLGASFSQTISNGDKLGISVVGTTVTAYYKAGAGAWTALGNRTDSTYSAAGKVGLRSSGTSVVLDDFGGGSV